MRGVFLNLKTITRIFSALPITVGVPCELSTSSTRGGRVGTRQLPKYKNLGCESKAKQYAKLNNLSISLEELNYAYWSPKGRVPTAW